jgi:hypothetical protein
MPCSQNRGWHPDDNYQMPIEKDNTDYYSIKNQLEERKMKMINKQYTAMLCALFNDLKNRNILEDVLESASNDGKIDFKSFIEEHEKEDIERLKKELLKFSNHERQLLLKILNK